MNLKKKVEKVFQKNSFTSDWLYSHYKKGREDTVAAISEEMSKFDTLVNLEPLKTFKTKIVEQDMPFWSYNITKTERRMYGIHSSIFSGIKDKAIYFPSSEHGLILHNRNWADTQNTARAGCVTFGAFRKKILKRFYDTPIYCVGPYIHYAKNYYNPSQMQQKKETLGKNLLVFPTHGTDDFVISYSEKVFLEKIMSMRQDYDTITVCIYWWNLDDPLINVLKKEGCRIVSAGYREDTNFLSRLKAIIDLSDFAIGDSVGTNIGYCLERNVPFCYFEGGTKKQDFCFTDEEDQAFVQKNTQIIKDAFLNADRISDRQLEIGNYYWGLNELKTPEEIYNIYLINKEITMHCMGILKNYGVYARKLLEHGSKFTQSQRDLLCKSL